jgi:RNA polymerase sigma-70 factor (ECF subfamily)
VVDAGDAMVSGEPLSTDRLISLYERFLEAIYRFIYAKVGNRQDAEDLTSQVFLKAVRGLDQARDDRSAHAWLFQVARTTVADYWREFYQLSARSLDSMLDEAGNDQMQGTLRDESARAAACVERLLALLPPRYREVLTYRFLLDCSLKDTAGRMGLSESNVKVLQYRALKKANQIDISDCLGLTETPT